MEKKLYEKPTMTVVRLQSTQMLLSSIVGAKRRGYDNGVTTENGIQETEIDATTDPSAIKWNWN